MFNKERLELKSKLAAGLTDTERSELNQILVNQTIDFAFPRLYYLSIDFKFFSFALRSIPKISQESPNQEKITNRTTKEIRQLKILSICIQLVSVMNSKYFTFATNFEL
ncbi:Hypothetical_protein [Hexamita inflata]|uniref:Hypothetical_protein n=1 Tax=Hexamita inflata TaxID=28002 RepID=A0AA86U207_9EUKA|nr:Hypothetical protein HINF_LOCUS15858 [Hexamita inflata]